MAHLPQHRLVPLLAACAEAWGRPPMLNHSLRSVGQSADRVHMELHNPQVCCMAHVLAGPCILEQMSRQQCRGTQAAAWARLEVETVWA